MEQLTARKAKNLELAKYSSTGMLQPADAGNLSAKNKELPNLFIAVSKLPREQMMIFRLLPFNLERNS